jgi:hypothetical protein
MSERGVHTIAADLAGGWLEDWMGVGLVELELYLSKVAAFERFLLARERARTPLPRAA